MDPATAADNGMVYCGKSKSWIAKPAYLVAAQSAKAVKRPERKARTKDKDGRERVSPYPRIPINAPHAIPAHQLDYSVSGLGAYRSFRRLHPGKSFATETAAGWHDGRVKDDAKYNRATLHHSSL